MNSPTTVAAIAEKAGHGVDAAREYLDWFERMGIVTQVTTSPATYERNQAYFDWRRVEKLRQRYTTDELLSFLDTAVERDTGYRETFDSESPTTVSIRAHAAATDRSVEAVWEDVSAWKTTRRQISLLERALTSESRDSTDERTAV